MSQENSNGKEGDNFLLKMVILIESIPRYK
jgi:hypothetical protein